MDDTESETLALIVGGVVLLIMYANDWGGRGLYVIGEIAIVVVAFYTLSALARIVARSYRRVARSYRRGDWLSWVVVALGGVLAMGLLLVFWWGFANLGKQIGGEMGWIIGFGTFPMVAAVLFACVALVGRWIVDRTESRTENDDPPR